ncbi:MAG: flagellar hook capping FlgD N-terminal domain-containing protein [Planctomycetota bacterium]
MSQISQASASSFTANEAAGQVGSSTDGYNELDIDSFLQLLISELQNQDPLNPMENSEMVAQIGQIREIGATDALTKTLTNLSDSQELVTASGLIGKEVDGINDSGSSVRGVVDRITVDTDSENSTRTIKVHVGATTMNLRNIREVTSG